MKIPKPNPIKALILILCLVCAFSASAYDFVKDGIYYNKSGSNVTVTYKDANYNSYSGTVNIPATVTYNGTTYNVTSIGMSAFSNCTDLIRVVIPNSVQYIMNYAFQNCTGLLNITLPASLAAVYQNVFSGCTSLKSIICLKPNPGFCTNTNNFPTSVYSDAILIVPQGYKSNYQSSSLWSNFSTIEEMDCDFAVDAIFYNDLGDNKAEVTDPCSYTYYSNYYTGDVVIPSTVTHGGNTYTVTAIHPSTFYYCHYLNSVSIPTTVSSIGNYAFYDCTSLTSCTIPEGVENIEYCTFGNCPQLSSVVIPSSVTWIAQNAFVNCNALTSITCRATTPPICTDSSCFPTAAYSNATLYVPDNAVSQYQSTSVWQNFSNIVGKSYDFESNGIYYRITGANTAEVTYKDRNFNSYSGNVEIPQAVTYGGKTYTVTGVGAYAFMESSDLQSITLPATVTYLGYAAFYKCTSLQHFTLPANVSTMGEFCFQNCTALKSFSIPYESVLEEIPRQCFTYCESLLASSFPPSVKVIGPFAYYQCSSMTSAGLTMGLEHIQPSAFNNCTSLTQVGIPGTVTAIDELAFAGCTSLQTFMIGGTSSRYRVNDGVLYTIAGDTLVAYPNMHASTYEIPSGVQVIGYGSFAYCTNVTDVTIPSSVKTIESLAFEGCTGLTSITLPDMLERIGDIAFYGCDGLASVNIPASVTTIEDGAFAYCANLKTIGVEPGNTAYKSDHGVLYSADGQTLIQYPCARENKHYSVANTTRTLGSYCFSRAKVKSVYLPQSLQDMGREAFYDSEVERVVIDEGLEVIPTNGFSNCSMLQSVYLPSTIKEIGPQAFFYSLKLRDITIAVDGTAPTIGANAFSGLAYELEDGATVYVPEGMTTAYSGQDDWLDAMATFTTISPLATGTEFTVDSLMYKTTDAALNTTVTDVTSTNIYDPGIPPKVAYQGNLCTVTSLTANSFQNCTRMVKVEVPFTVRSIGNYAFYNCRKVDNILLNEGVQQIGGYAFSHMSNLDRIWIPASVDSIRSDAFIVDPLLYGIYVTEGNTCYTSIDAVLYTKDGKRLVSFPEGKTTDYTVPDGTEVISAEAFRGNVSLTNINMPNSLRVIEGHAFFGCTALPTIEVPNGVTTIGNYAFYNCSSLTSADLPATLTSLGYYAFVGANGLTTLTVRATTPPTCAVHLDAHSGTYQEPFSDAQYSSVQLIVPRGSAQAYRQATVWKKFQNIIEADFPVEVMRGDVNNDGAVDIADATALINYLLYGNGDGINLAAADVSEDDEVDIADATTLINYLLYGNWPGYIDMWYLWGNFIGTTPWGDTSGNSPIGASALPLYPTGNFDMQGKGTLTWTGCIPHGYFSIVHKTGYYDDVVSEMWVKDVNTGEYSVQNMIDDNPNYDTILLDEGYYTITLDTRTMNLSIEPSDPDVPAYGSVVLVGYFNNWNNEANPMDGVNTRLGLNNHDWWLGEWTQTKTGYEGDVKFCLYGSWDYDWGTNTFPFGTGVQGGQNIPAKKGTYYVFLNDITGQYHFIKK